MVPLADADVSDNAPVRSSKAIKSAETPLSLYATVKSAPVMIVTWSRSAATRAFA